MKKALILFALLAACNAAFAQLQYEGYTAAAHNGLILRSGPSKDAGKIAVIPKGGRVSIQEDVDSSLSYSVSEFPGFAIKGYWVKVCYLENIGYVFSGYLSRFPPLPRYITPEGEQYNENEYEYLMRYFTERGHKPINYFDLDTVYRDFKTQFNDGIHYHYRATEALMIKIEFSQHSFQEVYLFYLLISEPYSRAQYIKETKEIVAFEPSINDPEEVIGCDYRISSEGNKVILTLYYTC